MKVKMLTTVVSGEVDKFYEFNNVYELPKNLAQTFINTNQAEKFEQLDTEVEADNISIKSENKEIHLIKKLKSK